MFVYCSSMEMAVTVGLERALETQRVRLLRLLTGWLAVVAVLSAGPLAVPLPLWARAYFDDLLIRAELAAQYMVQVSARIQARGEFGSAGATCVAPASLDLVPEDVPSTAALLRRMRALRRVLLDLQRFGLRLLRRREGRAARPAVTWEHLTHSVLRFDVPQWIAPTVERPPDRVSAFS